MTVVNITITRFEIYIVLNFCNIYQMLEFILDAHVTDLLNSTQN